MRRILIYSSFVVGSLIVIAAFVTATSYIQLGLAILSYPFLAYFAFNLLPRNAWRIPKARKRVAAIKEEKVVVTDIDKRTFLKVIGAAGFSFFIFSLLGRRVDSLLSGRALNPGNPAGASPDDQISQAGALPTEGYRISEIDDDIVTYYGFTNKNGAWFIMREDTNMNTFRYVRGNSGFPDNWADREKLKYDYFHNLF